MHASYWTPATVVRHGAIGVACAAAFIASVNCKPGGGGPTSGPTTATSSVAFRMSASGAPKCTADFRWEWKPVSVSGSGNTGPITVPASGFTHYDQLSSPSGDPERGNICDFKTDGGFTSFAPGTWQIRLVDAVTGPIAQCNVTLRVGPNWAGFRQGSTTCKETPAGSLGFEYP